MTLRKTKASSILDHLIRPNFRKKIILAYIAAFLLVIALIFPFSSYMVHSLFINVMKDRALEIIGKIHNATDDVELVQDLKDHKPIFFYRVSVITDQRRVLYDSHTKSLLGSSFNQDYVVNHPEVEQAFQDGMGYYEGYSQILDQKFCYLAKTFDFHGKSYVLRIALPYKNAAEILQEFTFGFTVLATLILLLFSLMTWFIINYLTAPIRKIVKVIDTYQEDSREPIPLITGKLLASSDEFGKLATTYNALARKIQKMLEMRKDFIANASHELKTPITVILGFAETLHDEENLSKETVKEITGKIVRNSQRMSHLIQNLLTLSDIESRSTLRLSEIDLYALIKSCCALVQDAFPDAVIQLHKNTNQPLHFIGDPHLLEMSLTNLIENSAKYSLGQPEINIDLQKQKEGIQVIISDKGIGIAETHLQHIFERFYTVDKARSRKMGGSGLGLSIVAQAIDKHQGKISITSKLGEGSTFTLLFPNKIN